MITWTGVQNKLSTYFFKFTANIWDAKWTVPFPYFVIIV